MPSRPRFFKIRKTWSFHVVMFGRERRRNVQRFIAEVHTRCSAHYTFFGDVSGAVAVAVGVCLSSLVATGRRDQALG